MIAEKSPHVFIVEDDPIFSEIVKHGLEENNYSQIEAFSSGQQCIDNLHKMPEIVLLDYNLDDAIDGLHVLKSIKAFNPDTHVIMMSSQDNLEVAVNSLKYGAYDYVIKTCAAMERINDLLKRICRWNNILYKNRRLKRLKKIIAIGFGVFITLVSIIGILFPEYLNK